MGEGAPGSSHLSPPLSSGERQRVPPQGEGEGGREEGGEGERGRRGGYCGGGCRRRCVAVRKLKMKNENK